MEVLLDVGFFDTNPESETAVLSNITSTNKRPLVVISAGIIVVVGWINWAVMLRVGYGF